MSTRHRIPIPDLLKGLAVILMIQVHIMELFARQDVMDGPLGIASLFLGGVPAAPVFMLMMGYFAALGNKSPGRLIIRGMKLFAAGLLLNIGLNANLIWKVFFEGWGDFVNVWHYIFGVDILHLAGLSLVVTAIIVRLFKHRLVPCLLLILTLLLVPFIIRPYTGASRWMDYVFAFLYSTAGWSYFPLIPWLAYPMSGYLFWLIEKKYLQKGIERRYRTLIFMVLTVLIVFTIPYASGITHNLEAYYHHDGLFFLWALAFMGWWWALASVTEAISGKTRTLKYVKWLGMHVTSVYVIQWLIIGNIATSVFKSMSVYSSVACFILILIFTSLFTFYWNKVKARYPLNFLNG